MSTSQTNGPIDRPDVMKVCSGKGGCGKSKPMTIEFWPIQAVRTVSGKYRYFRNICRECWGSIGHGRATSTRRVPHKTRYAVHLGGKHVRTSVITKLTRYAGEGFASSKLRNPNITKREAIEIANYIAELERAQKWVPVEEALPDVDVAFSFNNKGSVWVKIKEGDVQISCYDPEHTFSHSDVTHWMYLVTPSFEEGYEKGSEIV